MNLIKYAFEDLKKQRIRTVFGVFGILVSVALLTTMGSLSDSMSYSYLDQATQQVGSADITFTKVLSTSTNFDPYFPETIISNKLENQIPEIEAFFPRLLSLIEVNNFNQLLGINVTKQILLYGIDTVLEQENGNMGNIWIADENYTNTGILYDGPIENGHCILTIGTAKIFNIKAKDTIYVRTSMSEQSLIVDELVIQENRFSLFETSLLITELPYCQFLVHQPGNINYILATIKNPEKVYDIQDITGTTLILREIGEKVQNQIGFDYSVELPKMAQLDTSQSTLSTMSMIFNFISIFSMIITSILINSILTTSIEERIREFGIMRVLGARRKFIIELVLLSGFLLAIIGATLGSLIGTLLGPSLLKWILSFYSLSIFEIDFIIQSSTIIRSFLIGIGVTTAISFLPALKAGKDVIADAIQPTRNTANNEYAFAKEGNVNAKLMAFGLSLALVGFIIFLIFPQILTTNDTNLLNSLLLGLLLCLMFGLVFASVGIVPMLESLISQFFRPFIKRIYPVYRLSLNRYRQRNNGNIVMFSLAFAFIFFISTTIEIQNVNVSTALKFQYGAHLVLSNDGGYNTNDAVDIDLLNELQLLPGVRSVAPILTNALDFTKLASRLFAITEEGLDTSQLRNFSSQDLYGRIPKMEAKASDIGDFKTLNCKMFAINSSYTDIIDKSFLMWDDTSGSSDACLTQLQTTSNNCIIAKSLADALGITEIGQKIRLNIYNPLRTWEPQNLTIFTIIGISKGLPGTFNFRSGSLSATAGSAGVLLNFADYSRVMQWGNMSVSTTAIDKILIKVIDPTLKNLQHMQTYIKEYFETRYRFIIDEAESIIEYNANLNNSFSSLMQIALIFSIIISLFGLITSMYSTLLERMYELGILRTLGLYQKEIQTLLRSESLTMMLASGTVGMSIGVLLAYMLLDMTSILTEIPSVLTINIGNLFFTYIFSIVLCIIGTNIVTQGVRKWSIIDTLHTTF